MLALIRTMFLFFAAFVLASEASAHPGHNTDARLSDTYHLANGIRSTSIDAPQLRARDDCPNDGNGVCCCTEQIAHAPLQPCAIVAPKSAPLTTRPVRRDNVSRVRDVLTTTQPPVIGSRGTRGPPAA